MNQNKLKTLNVEPHVGMVDRSIALSCGGGKMTFVSKSKPFMKDGRRVCKVTRCINVQRQKEKAMCTKLGMNRKQFKRWQKANRHKEIGLNV